MMWVLFTIKIRNSSQRQSTEQRRRNFQNYVASVWISRSVKTEPNLVHVVTRCNAYRVVTRNQVDTIFL